MNIFDYIRIYKVTETLIPVTVDFVTKNNFCLWWILSSRFQDIYIDACIFIISSGHIVQRNFTNGWSKASKSRKTISVSLCRLKYFYVMSKDV